MDTLFTDVCISITESIRFFVSAIGMVIKMNKYNIKCPSEYDLAALIDGLLDENERQLMFAHFEQCHTCYHEWLHLSSAVPSAGYRYKLEILLWVKKAGHKIKLMITSVQNHTSISITRLTAGFAVAMAGIFLFLFINLNMNQLSQESGSLQAMINRSCKNVTDTLGSGSGSGSTTDSLFSENFILNNNLHYGFSMDRPNQENDINLFKYFFSQGLKSAKNDIQFYGKNENVAAESKEITDPERIKKYRKLLKQSPYSDDYQLGRWCFVIWKAGLSNAFFSKEFWYRQYLVSEAYLEKYSRGNYRPALKSNRSKKFMNYMTIRIEKINKLLKFSDQKELSRKSYRLIASESNDIIQHIATSI